MKPSRAPPGPISIWQPQTRDGETVWVRPPPGQFGDHYAERLELRRKRAELPLRVVLFGESVAAGYLYAPRLTPAGVLQEQLQCIGGLEQCCLGSTTKSNDFEVIDLARTNETLDGLRSTVRAALQINPDVLVLFVGNNWTLLETPDCSAYAPDPHARQRFGQVLTAEGMAGAKRAAREQLTQAANQSFAEIALIARTVGIPVIVVVPEVNLADWENRQPPVWLPADGIARWYQRYQSANEALDQGRWDQALALATAMQELDGAENPSSWRLLARAWAGKGEWRQAALAARGEVSATDFSSMGFLAAPQIHAWQQEWLRALSRQRHWTVVDLPVIFAKHSASPLPGHELFLDYCHLSAKGIGVAMAAVAAAVLAASGMLDDPPDWQQVLTLCGELQEAPETEALAQFAAAVHNSHRLLSTGVKASELAQRCRAALAAAPGIESAMMEWLEARLCASEAVFTAALHRNADSPFRMLLQHGWRWAQLDAELITVCRALLPQRVPTIDRWLLAAALGKDNTVDLAVPPFRWLWEPLERCFVQTMDLPQLTHPAYFRAFWPQTEFALVVAGTEDWQLTFTARLPALPDGSTYAGELVLAINGVELQRQGIGPRWTRNSCHIPLTLLQPGLNRLSLHWPMPPPLKFDPITAIAARLLQGHQADLHPVLGELFSLRVN